MSSSALHRPVSGERIPPPVGPYSPAVQWGELIFCSGQLGVDPTTGTLAEGIVGQTRQALLNLRDILQAAGSALEKVVKTTVFITDISDFSAMNAVYAEFFRTIPPARSTVEVSRLALGAVVEIEAIAYI
ncbi:MAG: RidA family protein [Candidatus Zipacnadales bacterium]